MRVLAATTAGAGHFGPLVPFAAACRRAGHEVVVTAPRSFASSVERAGFDHRPFADVPEEEWRAVMGQLGDLSSEEANVRALRELFAGADARWALPDLLALVDAWRPDLILREAAEFASFIAAESRAIPHVQVSISLSSFWEWALGLLGEPLDKLRDSVGLPADPEGGQLRSAPCLTQLPQSFDDSAAPWPTGPRRFRDPAFAPRAAPLPDWWQDSTHPLVYVTFGSVAAGLGLFQDLYRDVVATLADLSVRVLLTVGDSGDPEALEPLPANVHVERWWPQNEVMPHASAMIGHGGFGTTLAGLAAGVPMVVVPLFADQPSNARRVESVGAGVAVHGGRDGLHAVPAALERVLNERSYADTARRIAAEMERLPQVAEAVPFLEALVT